MKLRSRVRRAANTIKREDCSPQTNTSSEARVLVPNATLSVKQDSESCTLVKQEKPFAPLPIRSNTKVEPKEEMDKAIKQEETSKPKTALELYKNGNGYRYRCHLCFQVKESFLSLREHCRIVHKIIGKALSIKRTHLEPDVHDPNHFCQSCEKAFSTRAKYGHHLGKCHYFILKLGPDSNVIPDPEDPDLYCCSCKRVYKNWKSYRSHLILIHDMKVRPRCSSKNPAILPEWNNPNFYCSSCNTDYLSKKQYSLHCARVHKIKCPKKTGNQVELPDLHDPDLSCKLCRKSYTSKRLFRLHCCRVHQMKPTVDISSRTWTEGKERHLFIVHKVDKIDEESKQQVTKQKPDINDPNNYCCACDKTHANKRAFKLHLVRIHSLNLRVRKSRQMQPDVNGPNHYCCICKQSYHAKKSYHRHLLTVYYINPSSIQKRDPNCLPNPLDPNWHCCVCKKRSQSLYSYRKHCRYVYRMVLASIKVSMIVNPDATIAPDDPNFYCAKCEKKLASKCRYKAHLRHVHKWKFSKPKVHHDAIDVYDPNRYCAQCQKHLSSKGAFKKHINRVHKLLL